MYFPTKNDFKNIIKKNGFKINDIGRAMFKIFDTKEDEVIISATKNNMKKINVSEKYNLPKEVKFCKKCVISNQRPRIVFDNEGICSACRYFEYKEKVDFKEREDELKKLLDKHRSNSETYDCVVPSSGGKRFRICCS